MKGLPVNIPVEHRPLDPKPMQRLERPVRRFFQTCYTFLKDIAFLVVKGCGTQQTYGSDGSHFCKGLQRTEQFFDKLKTARAVADCRPRVSLECA